MQINPREELILAFKSEIAPFKVKSKTGALTLQDLEDLNARVDQFKSNISETILSTSQETSTLSPISESGIEEKLLGKVARIKEKNLAIQKNKLIEEAQKGELHFADLKGSVLPFSDKMAILLAEAGSRELMIKGVPDANGQPNGELRLVIKEDAILDSDRMVLSQISDPIYREALQSHESQKHYSFEFFDVGRKTEIEQKLRELRTEKETIKAVKQHLLSFIDDENEEEFNRNFTAEQRALYEILPDKQLDYDEIYALYQKNEDMISMFGTKEESVKTELAKATIRGRFCEDGSIGELKSVNIHSRQLGGSQLMSFWDNFCSYMEPAQVYLEDDAKIEGKTGSYNLRLFRLMALPDRTSWYSDSYAYKPYQKEEGKEIEDIADFKILVQQNIAPFREMTLYQAAELLQNEGIPVNQEVLSLLEKYIQEPIFGGEITLGELTKRIGDRVKTGEELHKEIDLIFSAIKAFSEYSGTEEKLLALKIKAEQLVNDRFYRKSYAEPPKDITLSAVKEQVALQATQSSTLIPQLNQEDFLDELTTNYLSGMRQLQTYWGGDIELNVISEILESKILIKSNDEENVVIGDQNWLKTIQIKFTGDHYYVVHGSAEFSIQADGDCLFNACIQANKLNLDPNYTLVQSTPEEVSNLRNDVCNRLELDRSRIKERYRCILEADTVEELHEAIENLRRAPRVNDTINMLKQTKPGLVEEYVREFPYQMPLLLS